MEQSRVTLPSGVREPFTVYVNGVKQTPGTDYTVEGGVLVFDRPLAKEGKLGFWKWFWGAFGIGHYGKNDEVDVSWSVNGRPRLAHALEIDGPSATP